MNPEFSTCGEDELPQLIALLDAEFVVSRGRSVSLAARFPALFTRSNLANLFVARERTGGQTRVLASIAVKPFRWIASAGEFQGAMLGAVWVHPERRRDGLGSRLLSHVNAALHECADFAVLWTAQPAFYARCGWTASDAHAAFGEAGGSAQADAAPADPVEFSAVREIWQQQQPFAAREDLWQAPLPLPALTLEVFRAPGAYVIAGRADDTLYCYEMLGDAAAFGALIARMRGGCARLCVNARAESPAYRAFAAAGIVWQAKPLAMWLPLKRDVLDNARDWYVPWLDRI